MSRKRSRPNYLSQAEIVQQILLQDEAEEEDNLDDLNAGEVYNWLDDDFPDQTEGEEEQDNSDEDEVEVQVEAELNQRITEGRRRLRRNRIINDFDAAFNPDNYDR